jgi:hypothetical protein
VGDERRGADLLVALVVATVAGAVVATVVGGAGSRVRGLSLAVSTFAFSLATTSFLVSDDLSSWSRAGASSGHRCSAGSTWRHRPQVFTLALVVLVLVATAVRAIRGSRTAGRWWPLRDNDRAAQSYGVHAPRLRLVTLALSGGIAALAGALFVHHQQAFDASSYGPIENLSCSPWWWSAGSHRDGRAARRAVPARDPVVPPADWRSSHRGCSAVLFVLWLAPGGLATLPFAVRDRLVRALAGRGRAEVPTGGDRRPGLSAASPAAAGEVSAGEVSADVDRSALLVVEGVEASYGPVQILFGIDLHVSPGGGRGPPRHERRRQVHPPASGLRADRTRPGAP